MHATQYSVLGDSLLEILLIVERLGKRLFRGPKAIHGAAQPEQAQNSEQVNFASLVPSRAYVSMAGYEAKTLLLQVSFPDDEIAETLLEGEFVNCTVRYLKKIRWFTTRWDT